MLRNNFPLAISVLLLLASGIKAGDERMNARIGASQFFIGGYVACADNKYANVTLSSTAYVINSTARVSLALDNYAASLNYAANSALYLRVVIKISYMDASGNAQMETDELIINHNATGVTNDKSSVVLKNAHAVVAKIVSFKDASGNVIASPFIPSNVYLEAQVETDRIYTLNPLTLPVANHVYLANTNELDVYWNTITGAEEYELEYTFVNNIRNTSTPYDYAAVVAANITTLPNTGLEFTFNNNATRIRTFKNNFKISLNFDRGLLVYRVRAIGKSISNSNLEVIGDWTLNQPQNVLSMTLPGGSFNDFYNPAGHEENKNWQSNTVFAEEGKKKDVINYFDGSNRKRQTVTRNNSDYVSLIGESVYDSQGRPAINILPSPYYTGVSGFSGQLKYFEDVNQSATQAPVGGFRPPFSRVDFENTGGGTCPAPAGGLYTGILSTNPNGASLYYSSNNPVTENQNSYLPDAFNYPFTHNIYTPDNTGRVRYQSGIGPEQRIGTGHETKYVYGDADQADLDQLFGSEAGFAEKYKRNMVVDANGQISVSYLNTEDKVVATSLAGNAPPNLNPISGLNVYPKSSTYMDYQTGNYNTVNLASGGALTFKKKILPDISGNYNFSYDLTLPQFASTCTPGFCYDCVYDLAITLKDECNTTVYSGTAFVSNPVNYTCGAPIVFTSPSISTFTSYLTAGKEYFLTKVLTINNDAQSQYLTHFINPANNICIKDLSYFQNIELAKVDMNDCHMSCSSCTAAVMQYYSLHNDGSKTLTTGPNYDPSYIFMSVAQRDMAIEQCMKPCKPATLCQTEFEMMLQDMRPMGQYAQYTVTALSTYTADNFELSIFNDDNFLRISTIYDAPTQNNGTPFVTYDISTNMSHWRYPEYYNTSTHNFTTPDANYTRFHYFDANGVISKVRIIPTPNGGYFPNIVNSTTLLFTDAIGLWTYPENLANLKDFVFAYSNNPQWAYSLVKNHPEFNYFLDCDRQSNPAFTAYTSEKFDADLRQVDTYAVATASWTSLYGNTVNGASDLLASDPYFGAGGPGSAQATAFLGRLTNYKNSGLTLKQMCAQMYSTAQMYYSTCGSAATFGATSIICSSITYNIPTSALDAMWKAYRELYLTEKQAFILEQAHIAACQPGNTRNNYYNGAIGDQNFTPYPSIVYGFNPYFIPSLAFFGVSPFNALLGNVILAAPSLWPNYPLGANGLIPALFHPTAGSGYYDFGSPSSFYHKGRYANKLRRVPDLQTLSNSLAGGATDPQTLANNLAQTAAASTYFETGQCPVYKQLELFLTRIAQNGTLFNFNTPQPLVSEPSFTKDLYDAIVACGGLTASTWNPLDIDVTQVGNTLTISFYPSGSSTLLTSLVLTNVSGSPVNWNDIKGFSNVFFNGTNVATGISNFNIKALYEDLGNQQPYSLIQFSGTTCIPNSCTEIMDLVNGEQCKPTQQALEIQNFLSAVVNDKFLNSGASFFNLGALGSNNCSSYFTPLLKTPFSNTLVTNSPMSHSVTIVNGGGGANINIEGKDGGNQVVTVQFQFFPPSGATILNLTNAVAFSNITPNQTGSTNYDFTLKTYYNGGAVQTFSVKVSYSNSSGSLNPCSSIYGNSCILYKLKTCEPYVPIACENNPYYRTKVQLENLMNDLFDLPLNATYTLANIPAYTNLLQSQIGQSATYVRVNHTAVSNTVIGALDHRFDFTFFTTNPVSDTTCKIRLIYNNPFATNFVALFVPQFTVTDIAPVSPQAPDFTASMFDPIFSNNATLNGSAPCLKMQICGGCRSDSVVLFENFESYTPATPQNQYNFTCNKYDLAVASVTINCNNLTPLGPLCLSTTMQNFGTWGDYAIVLSPTCYGVPDNTPGSTTNKVLSSQIFHNVQCVQPVVNVYLTLWQTTSFLQTYVGKKYKFKANYLDLPESAYEIQLIAEDQSGNEYIIGSKKNVRYGNSYIHWEPITGEYIATTPTTRFKIKLLPTPAWSFNCGGVPNTEMYRNIALDDISIKKMLCEDDDIVPIVDTDPVEDDCLSQLTNIALTNGLQNYKYYINGQKKQFLESYTQKCYQTLERLKANYQSSEGHFTLYYYDQAGNLLKTIPPEGVEPVNLAATDPNSGLTYGAMINNDRVNNTKTVFTSHRMATRYEYNSLNQLIKQQMPDHTNADLYTTTNSTSLPANVNVLGMDFSNNSQGYLVGNNGVNPVLYITNNGGTSWSPASGISAANIIDVEYSSSPNIATAILSDGNLLVSTNYNTATPGWTIVNMPGAPSMQYTDIEYDALNNFLYICGRNGLLLRAPNTGTNATWTTVNLGNLNDLNHLDFKQGYGVVVGNNGTLFHLRPNNFGTWQQFNNLNSNVDLLNVSIIRQGNYPYNYINAVVCGTDKNFVPGRGTVINILDLNGPSPVMSNLYLNPNANSSKIEAIATNTFATTTDVFFGGVEMNPSATTIFKKLTSPNTNVYTSSNVSLSGPFTSNASIKDVVVTNYGSGPTTVRAVTENSYYISTTGSSNLLNGVPNRITPDPVANVYSNGLIPCTGGTMLSYLAATPGFASQSNITLPVLNAITAAKDGSGKVMAVGNNGSILYSSNFGNSWTPYTTIIANNLFAAKYVSGTRIIVAGQNSYACEFNPQTFGFTAVVTSNTPGRTYYSISHPLGNSSTIFLAGGNPTTKIDSYTTPAGNTTQRFTSAGGSLKKLEFASGGVALAVGNAGVCVQSTNNGGAFTALGNVGSSPNLTDLIMVDQYTAYTFGAGSSIFKTLNSGVAWVQKTSPSSNISAAYNFGNGNLLAVGSGATNIFTISDQSNDYASRFFYDALGRLIISQNSKQFNKSIKAYSYTIYDAIGRITEVGEISGTNSDPLVLAGNINGVIPVASYTSWLASGSKSEVTKTVYDVPVTNSCGFTQENLRKRVAATYIDGDANLLNGYLHATYYTYDIHGNVKSLLQENPAMPVGQTCKKIDYSYDLVSGKVNKVSYQSDQPDAWHHKYEYDADNRITTVYTSKDNVDWTRDAKYFYYLHGPLARTEIGHDKVQGLDYAYTLQGWIKGINSVNLSGTNDVGKDGQSGTGYNPGITDLHKYITDDAVGYALHYYGYNSGGNFINDYKAIAPAKNTSPLRFDGDASAHPYFTLSNSLFNGNIMAMATTIYTNQPNGPARNPQLATYKYDQLNRLNLMQTTTQLSANLWAAAIPANLNNYRNEFSYDPNGNILSQRRYDNAGVQMDNMTYQYLNNGSGRKLANRLYHVNDGSAVGVATGDIDDQGTFNATASTINAANNYGYDETGNLVRDNQEGIATVDWTVYGKIKSITRTGASTARNLIFGYDAAGNRVSKASYTNGQAQSLWQTTYYVRDAQGNIMATYDYKPAGGSGPLTLNLEQQPIYGSSRLGQRNYYDASNLAANSPYKTNTSTYTLALPGGNVTYEVANHLGNVLTVVSDRKVAVPNGGNPNLVDRYIAEISSTTDYYPFGSPMPRRQFNNGTYRYGFNGKENDNEVKGTGNQQDYGMRIYDPRLGRFLSVDPLSKKFAMLSPYQFASNTPIQAIDLDGLEAAVVRKDVTSLMIVIQGWNGNNPSNGHTQAQNNSEGIDYAGIAHVAGAAADKPQIQVVVFSSSSSENTKDDVLKTIKDFKTLNPNGNVIIAAHSMGADNAVELVNENPEVKVDLLITVDLSDTWDDDNIPGNVKNAINIYKTNDGALGSSWGGEDIEIDDPSKTNGVNIPVNVPSGPNGETPHQNIDNVYGKAVSDLMINFTKKETPKEKTPTPVKD